MIRLGISGFCGKMGQRIFALAKEDGNFTIAFGLENKGHPQIGEVREGVKILDNPEGIKDCDCLIEFTTPFATVEHLAYLVKFKKCAVIGTTGLDQKQQDEVKDAARVIPIVFSPNMSIGVNLLFKLVKLSAQILKNYTLSIEEAHHIHKKDAPSGTAKKIAQIADSEGFAIKSEDIKVIREDEIVGNHKVIFESNVDKIEIFHSAKTRDIFAQGALLAARWIINKKAGLYSMEDVLGLEK
jgi:4-hydroxy-tetrahydrodipicolinate reductase